MKHHRPLLAVLLVAVAAATAAAITVPKVNFTDTRLKNGLRVIVSPDHAAPVVSVAVAYNVGSRNERSGRTGFAHLFEHLMFKGSENVADGELASLIENYGGSHNGQTDKDHTIYFEQVPSNQLDMVLFLEADRMRSPAITQENVNNQREAVKEERRLRVDNQPYGRTSEAIAELAFDNFANEHSIIGSMADLDAASLEDFSGFFKTYYAPNNAVLAIAGDIDEKTALAKVRKYFEDIPPGPPPPPLDTAEPPQKDVRRVTLQDPHARLTLVDVAHRVPGGLGPDVDALSAVSSVLGAGRSSRLYDSLVRRQQLAVQTYAGMQQGKGPGLFYLEAMVAPGKSAADVEAALYAEIEKVQKGPIEEWELEKARNAARRSLVSNLRSSLQRAILLARYAVYFDDPGIINTRYERIASLTIEDLQRVARQYLVASNRTVAITVPAPKTGAEGAKGATGAKGAGAQ
ncbi:MAG: insulinase family protein [Acidobacteria bacterium]|nr:MAG: insulinase family protein [Acidobacteriota bacterium]